jgi:predicted secreted protein
MLYDSHGLSAYVVSSPVNNQRSKHLGVGGIKTHTKRVVAAGPTTVVILCKPFLEKE